MDQFGRIVSAIQVQGLERAGDAVSPTLQVGSLYLLANIWNNQPQQVTSQLRSKTPGRRTNTT